MTLTGRPTSNRTISQCSNTLAFLPALLLILAFGGTMATAQENAPAIGPVATLRVSTNIIQIPVLVLTKNKEEPYSPIAPNRFEVSLGGGPWDRPRYARLEGEDPISLAILLDPRQPQSAVLEKMNQGLSSLAASSLTSRDRVSIFLMGCSSMQVVEDLPADPNQLRSAADSILQTRNAKDSNGRKIDCKDNTRLFDALAYVTRKMEDKPGRRTILAVTNGDEKGSKIAPLDLITLAQLSGVTIFALDPANHLNGSASFRTPDEQILSAIAESTGGLRLESAGTSLDKELKSFVKMLRARYIVEFPRPPATKAGKVQIAVRITGAAADAYFIRIAGKSVPLPNPASEGNRTVQMATTDEPSNDTIQSPSPQTSAPADTTAAITLAQPPTNDEHPSNAPTQSAQLTPQPTDAQSLVVSGSEPPPATATLHVSTKLTVEDVAVDDNNRKPVHGLTRDDFELKEDGHVQIIKHFEEYAAGKAPEQTPTPALAANIYSNAQPAGPATSAVNILLLDSVTTGLSKGLALAPENIAYARQQSLNYLRNLPPGTRVAILQLGANVRLLQSVTTDKSLLMASVNSVTYKPVPQTYVSVRDPRATCDAANMQSQLIVDELQQLAAYLAGIEGRKNLIWFTPGIPWLTQYQDYIRIRCLKDFSAQLHKAYSALTASRVALYPIDPRGLFSDPALSAAAGSTIMPGIPGAPSQPAMAPAREAAAFAGNLQGDQDSLKTLADATGGIPYFNRNDLDTALGEAITSGSDYYTLAYTPPASGYDGKFHTISVKVDKPNLHLQFRTGYTSVDPSKIPQSPSGKTSKSDPKPQELFQAAMIHGAVNSTQLTFDVRVNALNATKPDDPVIGTLNPALAGKQLVRYEFLYVVSPDQISLVDDANGLKKGEVEFVLAAYDSDGKLLNGISQTAHFIVKPQDVSRFMQKPMHVPIQFDLPPGNVFVRIGIRDVPSQKSGTLEVAETIARK